MILLYSRASGAMYSFLRTASPLKTLKETVRKHPMATAGTIAGIKTCVADAFVQTYVEKKPEVDRRRNAVFTMMGVGYLGCFQYLLYSRFFPIWFPGGGAKNVLKMVVFDQTINTGIWYYPLFYFVQDGIMNAKLEVGTFVRASERYRTNVIADMTYCWSVWVPAQLVNFSMVPLNWRSPFAALISLVWTCILSYLRGDLKAVDEARQQSCMDVEATSGVLTRASEVLPKEALAIAPNPFSGAALQCESRQSEESAAE